MKIKKKDVVAANLRYANQWAPRASGDSDSIFETKVAGRITVKPDDEESFSYIEVTFDTALVWMVADETPDASEVLTYLTGLIPVGVAAVAAPASIALNSQNVLSNAADLVANVIKSKSKSFFAKFHVPGVSPRPESWQLSATVQGSLLTTDTGPKEHACMPKIWAEMMDADSQVDNQFNVGGNELKLVDKAVQIGCVQIDGPMSSSMRVRGLLSTDGNWVGRTVSAALINEVRFRFSRCVLGETSISIEEPQQEEPANSSEDEGPVGGSGTPSPGLPHH